LATPLLAGIAERIVRAPFGALVGLEVVSVERDRVAVRLPFRPEVTTVGDLVHGGALAALVDTAATAAAWASEALAPDSRGTTVGFTINYLAGARGRDVIATARVARRGGSLCVLDVDVADAAGEPVARALVTYKLDRPRR
jgi:uncharacterized protein (TIGR00369 family)